MEKFHGHCQQQQDISHVWIACLRSRHFSLFICRCSEGEQARHVCRAGIPEPDAEHNSHMPRNTPKANIVCWTPCGQPGAIVMGADPDPFIRSQILRDANGFFGGSR